ncbi:hypothetical protein B9Z55_004364 [Caenorhabditis nigoni]|uniref:Uncharacterized protein n=1 Tax=Caenorhabditis nigoni TaxID=1611254 RepID=A0A2G5UW64_9PELO|nr:hypothetical protein B9Z55_004364 [Caenorhabditis nigoni]
MLIRIITDFFYPTNNKIYKESMHQSRPGSRPTTTSSPDNPGVRRGIYKDQRQVDHHHLSNPDANEDQREEVHHHLNSMDVHEDQNQEHHRPALSCCRDVTVTRYPWCLTDDQ